MARDLSCWLYGACTYTGSCHPGICDPPSRGVFVFLMNQFRGSEMGQRFSSSEANVFICHPDTKVLVKPGCISLFSRESCRDSWDMSRYFIRTDAVEKSGTLSLEIVSHQIDATLLLPKGNCRSKRGLAQNRGKHFRKVTEYIK